MKYFVTPASGPAVEVEVLPAEGGGYLVRVDGEEWEADFHDVDQLGQCAVKLGDSSFGASVERAEGGETDLAVRIAGRAFRFQVLDERERAAGELAAAAGGKAQTIKAAMPGIIAGVLAEVGQVVERDQPLVVLEAMKMQNEIGSEGGVVAELCVAEGDTVAAGDVLVRLEPPPEDTA